MQLHGMRIERVADIGQRASERGQQHQSVQAARAIARQGRSQRMRLAQTEFSAALGKAQKQRHQTATQQQPGRRCDANTPGARQQAQHETRCNDHHVQYRHMLGTRAVADVQKQIRQHQRQTGLRSQRCQCTGSQRQQQRPQHRDIARQRPAGQWPQALFRMPAIGFQIGQIVQHIDRAGSQTKRGKHPPHRVQRIGLRPGMTEQQTGQHETILGPLIRPRQTQQGKQRTQRCHRTGQLLAPK